MLTKNDCLTLLVKLEDKGLNIDNYMKALVIAKDIPMEVVKFIVENEGLEAYNFYEILRKNYNNKGSKVYKNLVTGTDDPVDGAVILSSLLTQIFIHVQKISAAETELFLTEIRAEEITKALNTYISSGDSAQCLNLLKLIKTDLLVLEYLAGHREK